MKTELEMPDELHQVAQRLARNEGVSVQAIVLREVEAALRRSLEASEQEEPWSPPPPRDLGELLAPVEQWRMLAYGYEPDPE